MRRLLNVPFSPLLLGIYPIVHIYSINAGSVDLSIVAPPILAAAVATFILMVIGALIMRDWKKGAILVNIALFSSYLCTSFIDSVCPWIYGTSISKFIAAGIIVLILVLLVKVRKPLRNNPYAPELTRITNFATTVLLLIPLMSIAFHGLMNPPSHVTASSRALQERREARPDVYYIILDGYAREDILKQDFGFDNSPFTNFLRRKGFFVASKSRSNYAYTYLSLASSLNMSYLNELNQVPDQQVECIQRITDNNVARLFRAHGYQIIHFAPMWVGMNTHSYSKNTFNPARVDEFQLLILKRFLLRAFVKDRISNIFRSRTHYTLRRMKELTKDPRPKFVFAHLLCPHPPYVFDREGKLPPPMNISVPPPGSMDWAPKNRYVDQLYFLNHLIEDTVTHILKTSKSKPIIIIQGDHGPGCDGTSDTPTPLMVRERMSILNAYYVPMKMRSKLYPSITPVNTFNVIGSSLFHVTFPLLPDESFYSGPMGVTPYEFKRVTQK